MPAKGNHMQWAFIIAMRGQIMVQRARIELCFSSSECSYDVCRVELLLGGNKKSLFVSLFVGESHYFAKITHFFVFQHITKIFLSNANVKIAYLCDELPLMNKLNTMSFNFLR